MKRAVVTLFALLLGGCAATQGVSVDPDHPKPVCVDTMEGTSGRTVCY